jgi:hypothetical protein
MILRESNVRSFGGKVRPLLTSVAVLCCAQVALANGPVAPGDDIWATPCGGGSYSDFSGNPIPADFFDPGSDPFSGQVPFGGDPGLVGLVPPAQPPSDVDTIVRRDGTVGPFTCGDSQTVAIEIISLSLVSCAPVTVEYNGGATSELWDVRVCLDNPQTPGTMQLNHECPEGGSYSSSLPVQVQLQFVRQSDSEVRSLSQNLTMQSAGWWSHFDPGFNLARLLPGTMISDLCTGTNQPTVNVDPPDFYPGLWSLDCNNCAGGPPATFEKPALTPEQAMLAAHGVYPANPERQSGGGGGTVLTEACCLQPLAPGNCIDVDPFDCVGLHGGVPQGPGTNCANVTCGGGGMGCPEPVGQSHCALLAPFQCDTGDPAVDECQPIGVIVGATGVQVDECFCLPPGGCGAVDIQGTFLSCPGGCPVDPTDQCQIFHDDGSGAGPQPLNPPASSVDATTLFPGIVSCDCAPGGAIGACCFGGVGGGALTDCTETTAAACTSLGGSYQGDGTVCGGTEACCLPDGTCTDADRLCCTNELGGTPQGPMSNCTDATCPQPQCEPTPDELDCNPFVTCPIAGEECVARCVTYDPLTGATIVDDCECRGPNDCRTDHVGPTGGAPGNPCVVMDNGTGTVTLPPDGCDYLSPDEVHLIIDGLPAGTTIELAPIHRDFICLDQGVGGCSQPLPPLECEGVGGGLGGNLDCFNSTLELAVTGTGALNGLNRTLFVPVFTEVHTGPRNPGDAVQDFDTEMVQLQGSIFGDPDFDFLIITGGSSNGLPSPGHTTLRDLGGGNFQVDSFFDITYQIEFQGAPGSVLQNLGGTTTGAIRMATGAAPQCIGGCPLGETCVEDRIIDPATGVQSLCCDCVADPVGACCTSLGGCSVTTAAACAASGGVYSGDGTVCGGVEACCLDDGSCLEADRLCCTSLLGGTPQGPASNCTDATCPQPQCEPTDDALDCNPLATCADATEECEPRCVRYDPLTGVTTVVACDCRGPNDCRTDYVGPTGGTPGNPCVVMDNGTGTVTLPPDGCDYLSPDEVHLIIDGLPAGTTIELAPIHRDFICLEQGMGGGCSELLPPGACEGVGGGLGGNLDCFNSTLELAVTGTGALDGFNRTLFVPVFTEVHTGPRNPGDAVQDFDTEMVQLQGSIFGDPDFDFLIITGGSSNGLPSPGHTTLRELGGGNFQVDSFFDITYQIEFQGAPGSVLENMSGTTTAAIHMATGAAPQCIGGCPAGQTCVENRTINPVNGVHDLCCDCVADPVGACCDSMGGCTVTTAAACAASGGVYSGDGTACGGVEACCLPGGSCIDADRVCCTSLLGGIAQGPGSNCGNSSCPQPQCEPTDDALDCNPLATCPVAGQECEPRCVRYDPLTGETTVVDCDCRGPDECRTDYVGPTGGTGNPCTVLDNGSGTVTLPPAGCEYLSPDEVHMIIEGLPAGTTIELAPIHKDFICAKGAQSCSLPIPPGECERGGGSLGGNLDCFGSQLELNVTGTGALGGFSRTLTVPIFSEVHTGPRNPGDPVQDFPTDMFRLQGELFGDPDFCTLRVIGGSDNGLPSPGHTTLTNIGGGTFQVDSFFDITYQIEFQGCPTSPLAGMSGTTTATIRMETGTAPQCIGDCPPGQVCIEDRTVDPATGIVDLCCDCVNAPTGACCFGLGACIETTGVNCGSLGGVYSGDGTNCGGLGACCLSGGTCILADQLCCQDLLGGTPQGAATLCAADTCGNGPCVTAADCCDLNGDLITDDVCVWCECEPPPVCNNVPKLVPADMGGAFGVCPIDTFCNIHDRTHALKCFAGTNPCASINIDAGSPFGACPPDGFCNVHDANHALSCFAGTNACLCGPAPQMPGEPAVVGGTRVRLQASTRSAKPGETVVVRAFVTSELANLQAYQLHTVAMGGSSGRLELIDVAIEGRRDYVFGAEQRYDAVNVAKAQMLSGVETAGVPTKAQAYLATFTYRLSKDAAGAFVVDILRDEANGDQTFMISNYTDKIAVDSTTPAVITVVGPRK